MKPRAQTVKLLLSLLLSMVLFMTQVPLTAFMLPVKTDTDSRIVDPHTLDQWKLYFGTQTDHPQNVTLSTAFAGGVWTDKSVFLPGSIPGALTRAQYNDHSFSIEDKGDNFLIALSAIAASKETTGYSTAPTDTVLVLDMSSSMRRNDDNGKSAIDELVRAANNAISKLLSLNGNNRVAVVVYAGNINQNFSSADGTTQTLLPLDTYRRKSNGEYLVSTSHDGNADWAIKVAEDVTGLNGKVTGNKATASGTFIQDGIYEAMKLLLAAKPTVESGVQAGVGRRPIIALMTDGEPTLANNDYDGNDTKTDLGNSVMHDFNGSMGTYTHRETIAFMTMLTAAYAKKQIAAHYGDALFYTLAYGEEVTRLDEALSVMDPAQCSENINAMWNGFLEGNSVNVYRYKEGKKDAYLSVRNAESGPSRLSPADKLYVDGYFPAESDDDFSQAFDAIVNEIILQSKYYPTYVEKDQNHDGYLTFVDKIGSSMEISDIKGFAVGDRLFSGAGFAGAIGDPNDQLGTAAAPTALGQTFIRSVGERLGLTHTAAQALIADACRYGQIAYTNDREFSHYIGWFSDSRGNYLDFWHEGMTEEEIQTAVTQMGATHVNKNYCFLGNTGGLEGLEDTDMMYMTVCVSTELSTGESTLIWKIPASLLPTVTYEISAEVDVDGSVTDVTHLALGETAAKTPVRLLYEVELRQDLRDWDLTEDAVFYTNNWDEQAEDTTQNTYSYFEPSQDNERYYYTEDSLVYADIDGTVYTGTKPVGDGYYRRFIAYEKLANNELRAHWHYEPITAASLALAEEKSGGQWVIPKGTVHRYYDYQNIPKVTNATGTMNYSDHPFVVSRDGHSYTYSTQGNNGKLTVAPATGIKLTKTLREPVEGTFDEFTFTVSGDLTDAQVVRLDGNGKEASRTALSADGKVPLSAGETVYLIGLRPGTYTITETPHSSYKVESVTVDGVPAGEQAELTVTAETLHDVEFVNAPKGYGNLRITKEVTHALAGHPVPAPMLEQDFEMAVHVGTSLAGETFDTLTGTVTVGADGRFTLTLRHGQSVEILGLPEDTAVTVTEVTASLPEYCHYQGITTCDYGGALQDTDNQLRIYADETAAAVVYNTYAPKNGVADLAGTVSKLLAGRDMVDGEFTFAVFPHGEYSHTDPANALLIGTNTADGQVTFRGTNLPGTAEGKLSFAMTGTFGFDVVELTGNLEGVTYDTAVYHLEIQIRDNGNGSLYEAGRVIARENSDQGLETIVFQNEYTKKPEEITVDLDIQKTVVNMGSSAIGPGGFGFMLEDTVSGGRIYATSDAEGKAGFRLSYTEGDVGRTYTYKLTEINGGMAGVRYSTAEYLVTVSVGRNQDNALVVALTKNGKTVDAVTAEFLNFYGSTSIVTPPAVYPTPNPPPDSETDPPVEPPQTGDEADPILWFVLLALSSADILVILLYLRRRKEE